MKKIACCGYHATGSGVIDDLLREFDNISDAKYGVEVRILHDPDGISDLEYHIVTDPHRLGTGLAIRRLIEYAKYQDRMERKAFGKKWMSFVTEYAESLAVLKFKAWLEGDRYFLSSFEKKKEFLGKAFFYVLRQKPLCNIVPKAFQRPRWYDYHPNYETYYSNISEEEFISKTKAFVEKICSIINSDNKEYVVLDQFVCAHNPMRDLRFVDDMKVIVVDRDPRDLYVHNMMHKDHALPKDPKKFAIQYRLMRKLSAPDDPTKVLRVHYEDMIFKYDEMVDKVLTFLGIDKKHHACPKAHFNPAVSINGTQMWIYKTQEFNEGVKVIEQELPDMLYSFPDKSVRDKITSTIDLKEALKDYETKH